MRRVWLVCLLFALVGCNTRPVPHEEKVRVLETGRLGGVIQEKAEKDR
jgi:hypothetical protein